MIIFNSGVWCSGITFDLHSKGLGFDPRYIQSNFLIFDLYINDLINELDKNSFEVLAYADDLCVLCDGRNQLNNVIKIIDKWSKFSFYFFNIIYSLS